MPTESYVWCAVAIIALVTALTRFLPFWVFRNEEKVPRFVRKLGRILPYAVMGMLVVYCLKDVQFTAVSSWVPTVVSCLAVAGLHLWKRNTLLSILGGTLCHVVLVQFVF
ncbi:MAG: AzlD domain-containing protein [Clostridia bacterium]|nr:AzlD domain-containing protein [Clostridia bacterium]